MKKAIKRILLTFAIVVAALLVIGLILNAIGIGGSDQGSSSNSISMTSEQDTIEDPTPETDPESTAKPAVTETPESSPEPEAAGLSHPDHTLKSGNYDLPSGIQLTYSDSVRNDSTGNWRKSLMADSRSISDYAVEYYETMMADDEVHAVVNFTLNTTTCLKSMSGALFVDTYEYVKGEEHDANLLFTGPQLTSTTIDLSTGEQLEFGN